MVLLSAGLTESPEERINSPLLCIPDLYPLQTPQWVMPLSHILVL